jgi:hypothetical protein
MAVTFRPPHAGADRDDVVDAGDLIAKQLVEAGYVDVQIELLEVDELPAVCALGAAC